MSEAPLYPSRSSAADGRMDTCEGRARERDNRLRALRGTRSERGAPVTGRWAHVVLVAPS